MKLLVQGIGTEYWVLPTHNNTESHKPSVRGAQLAATDSGLKFSSRQRISIF